MGQKAIRPLLVMMMCVVFYSLYQFMDEPVLDRTEEQQLASMLEQIVGVGQVQVYFHTNRNSETTFDSYFQQDEPQIVGVLVVAEGATAPSVVRLLQKSVSQVLQIHAHRIVIVPMEMKEEQK